MKNAIILCSGGLDSVVTTYYVKNKLNYGKITVMFFNYGQRSLTGERGSCEKVCEKLGCEFIEVKLDWLGKISGSLINKDGKVKKVKRKELKNTKAESEKYYIPFRNGVFLSYAVGLADKMKGADIFVGFNSEGSEAYSDATPGFVEKMNKVMKEGKVDGKIKAPLIKKDKDEIVKMGVRLGVELHKTHSCYVDNKHCGVCLACRLRQEAFYWGNVKDETKYKEKMGDYRRV